MFGGQLEDNLDALRVRLTDEDIAALERPSVQTVSELAAAAASRQQMPLRSFHRTAMHGQREDAQ
jgi:hypothetical protein